jgi:hypothetical protein
MTKGAAERRRAPRIQPFVVPCLVAVGPRRVAGFLVELSTSGARVSTEGDAPPDGGSATLEVRLKRGLGQSRIPATVKWVRRMEESEGRYDFGLVFRDVSPADRKLLASIVREFRTRAAQLA